MRVLFFCLLLGALAGARASDELVCERSPVAAGLMAHEILSACGEPMFRERLGTGSSGADYDEEWLYNLGPRQPMRILRLREDRLVSIEDDGYGFNQMPKLSCDFHSLKERMSKFRVLLACQQPQRRETLTAHRNLDGVMTTIVRERWHYNAAGGVRVRTLTLENGRIVSVEEKKPARRP